VFGKGLKIAFDPRLALEGAINFDFNPLEHGFEAALADINGLAVFFEANEPRLVARKQRPCGTHCAGQRDDHCPHGASVLIEPSNEAICGMLPTGVVHGLHPGSG